MVPGEQIWSELEPRLKAIHPAAAPVVVTQSSLGPDEGGPPLARIVAYPASAPAPHWHFVTCGLSTSRFTPGYPGVGDVELSFRLAREETEQQPPGWVAGFLQLLSHDRFSSEEPLNEETPVELAEFWLHEHDTAVTHGFYIEDPVVPPGAIRLMQVVALTKAERIRVQTLSTGRVELLLELAPAGISDLGRERLPVPEARAAPPPPAPKHEAKLETVRVSKEGARMRVSIAAAEVPAFVEALAASVKESRVTFSSHGWQLHLCVDDVARSATWATTLMIYLTLELSKQVARELQDPARHGQPLRYAGLPDLELFVDGAAAPRESVLKKLGKFFGGS